MSGAVQTADLGGFYIFPHALWRRHSRTVIMFYMNRMHAPHPGALMEE